MKNLPTIDELITFFKDNIKIIILSIVSFLLIFAIGIGYTIYTDNKIENTINDTVKEDNLFKSIDETIPLEEQFDPREIDIIVDKLQEEAVHFSFYLEKEPAEPFTSSMLLKKLLTSPSVLHNVENQTNIEIEPSPEFAVNVDLDSKSMLMTMTIGTGNEEANKKLANAYYSIISEEKSPFFDNKTVYMMNEPEVISSNVNETPENSEVMMSNADQISYKQLIFLTLVVILAGGLFGIVISIVRSLVRNEVSEIYGFAIKDEDNILNISAIKSESKEEKFRQIAHSIVHPAKKVKLILSETDIDMSLIEILKKDSDVYTGKNCISLKQSESTVLIANNIIDINSKFSLDEVVLLCEKNKTSKKWYEKQRKLLENYKTDIKVILV